MKNQNQANNNLNDPTVANDPQTLVEDLTISGELEEQVKGGESLSINFTKIEYKYTPYKD